MKVKKLLASLLVSILVITSLPQGVLAYTPTDDTNWSSSPYYGALISGYTRLARDSEKIPGFLTEAPTHHTSDYVSVFSKSYFIAQVNKMDTDTSTNYEGTDWRFMSIYNTDGTMIGLKVEYIISATYAYSQGYEVTTKTEPASNIFYFAKYPDTFPITEMIADKDYSEVYIKYVNSQIENINTTSRDILAKAGAIYSDELNKNYDTSSANDTTLTNYSGKTYWCFDASTQEIIYGTTTDGKKLSNPTKIAKTAWYDSAGSDISTGTKTRKNTNINNNIEESNNYTSNNFKFVINQTKLAARAGSCWTCAQEAIVMNSGCLGNSGYQMTGVVTASSHTGWVKWSDLMGQNAYQGTLSGKNGGRYTSYCVISDLNGKNVCSGTWTQGTGADIDGQAGSKGGAYLIGWKNNGTTQYFKDMTFQQLQTVFKAFYNSGYWLTIGIRDNVDPSGAASADSDAAFSSNHTVMFAGMDNNHIMVLDSARVKSDTTGSKVEDYIHELTEEYASYKKGDGLHNVVYVMAFKYSDEKNSLKTICGGKDVYMTEADQYNLTNMGIGNKKGYFTEDQLSSMVVLSESDLSGVLADATLDNLDHNDLESLDTWKDLVEEENMAVKVIRTIIQLIGVLMLIWSILLFAGYHFDRVNNLVDISVVHILTLGRLRPITYDGEEATFGKDKSEKKDKISTVNSRNITTICVVTALFAVLILTGAIYNLLASLVNLINSILRR